MAVVGSSKELGAWDAKSAVKMTTNEKDYPKWKSEELTVIPAQLEYKYILVGEAGEVTWESGPNRQVYLDSQEHYDVSFIEVKDEAWD